MNILRLGSTGPDVIAWQNVLNLTASGVFDKETETATHAWQFAHNLVSDGVVGPASWKEAGVKDLPLSIPVQGLDISVVQGKNIPWEAEKNRGTSFVYMRCQVGNNEKDINFSDNTYHAMLANLFCGGYFFPFPLPHLDPKEQAELFVKSLTIDSDHALGSNVGELPPAYDLEWPPPEEWGKWKCTADQIVDWSIICLARIEKLIGCAPIIYSYPYFIAAISVAKNFTKLLKYKLWIAGGSAYLNGDGHIPDLSRERPPKVVGWGNDWLIWQHDGNGGRRLTHGVDADFNVFRLPLSELERYCKVAVAPMEGPPDTLPDLTVVSAETSALVVADMVHEYRRQRAEEIYNSGV